jgi:phosphoribosylanthranilate isomerase
MWVKICGINDVDTARWVAELSPDAIGLNFYSGSPRCVDASTARRIVRALPPYAVEFIGVFVDHEPADIIRICRECEIWKAQLHGDYSLADVDACLEAIEVIRVVRFRGKEWPLELTSELNKLTSHQRHNMHYLADAHVPSAYGGTGQTAPWQLLASHWPDWPPLILAGGLTPDNVSAAIQAVRPFGVDVASGVESSPGVKDRQRVERFIEQARFSTTTPNS